MSRKRSKEYQDCLEIIKEEDELEKCKDLLSKKGYHYKKKKTENKTESESEDNDTTDKTDNECEKLERSIDKYLKENNKAKLTHEIATFNIKIDEIKEKINKRNTYSKERTNKRNQQRLALDDVIKKSTSNKKEIEELQLIIEAHQKKILEKQKETKERNDEIKKIRSALTTSEEEVRRYNDEIKILKTKIQAYEEGKRKRMQQLDAINTTVDRYLTKCLENEKRLKLAANFLTEKKRNPNDFLELYEFIKRK